MLSSAELAAKLIGTRSLPTGLAALRALSQEARAYQSQKPYPLFHFRDWKTEDRGPLPVCLPLAKSIVERGAKWLFGKPVQLTVAGNATLEARLRDIWTQNRLDSRLRPMAKNAALDGGVVLKFAYDAARTDCPVPIMALSLIDEVRLYANPHDANQVLMARVQYTYFDAATGKTMWYREEWTDQEEVHYHDVSTETVQTSASKGDPDAYEGWEQSSRTANPFRLIPLHLVKNLETDDVWGAGDLWDPAEGNGLYRTLDRIHLTYHLMDKSNQFDSEVNPIFIDLELDDQDIDSPLKPGQSVDAHSTDDALGANKQGTVALPRGGNGLRPAMMEYAKDLRKQVLEAASSVSVDQAEFSNKGNLTSAVLEQLYQPQIELNNEKRKSWGPGGLEPFLGRLARGLSNAGVPGLGVTAAAVEVKITFGDYFGLSEDEKAAKTGRLQEQELAGYLPHDRAIEEISQMEGRTDVEALKKELAAEPRPTPTEQDPGLDNMETEIKGLTKVGGAESV